jgi:hypothetical protein
VARDVEVFFMCFMAIWTSSFEKALFNSFAHYLFIYSYVHALFEPSLPSTPHLLLLPITALLPGRPCSALFSNFVEEKQKNLEAT